MTENSVIDAKFMQRCLCLALQAEGRTAPNPVVGAVVLDRDGEVAGEGYHARAGAPHAEVNAFAAAGERARGGTLYVNLEPCCHFGRTPPCTDSVLASGVSRVVVGMQDPNPRVAGGGLTILRDHKISVTVGVLEEECVWSNRAFLKRMRTGKPWLCLKLAATLDGRIADRFSSSRWITGEEARQYVMQLRNKYDCVLIGGRTALHDDSALTVRDLADGRNPHRAVLDRSLAVLPGARIYQDHDDGSNTYVFCGQEAPASGASKSLPGTVKVVATPSSAKDSNHLDLTFVMKALADEGINSVLCEGGGHLAASLVDEDLIDEIQWIVAPKILGDTMAVAAVAQTKAVKLTEAVCLDRTRVTRLGNDVVIEGIIKGRMSIGDNK